MGFWGKLGKIALKAAPIAAAFIPGVGPLASMAISGATSAASKKLEGGSWKDALISGGVGAGTGYLGGKLPTKGIGPSATTADRFKGAAKAVGSSLLGGDGSGSKADMINTGLGMIGNLLQNRGGQSDQGIPPRGVSYEMEGQGLGPSRIPSYNPIQAGRREAIRNQPFREGYDVTMPGEEPADDSMGNIGPSKVVRMPPIYPNMKGYGGQSRNARTAQPRERRAVGR